MPMVPFPFNNNDDDATGKAIIVSHSRTSPAHHSDNSAGSSAGSARGLRVVHGPGRTRTPAALPPPLRPDGERSLMSRGASSAGPSPPSAPPPGDGGADGASAPPGAAPGPGTRGGGGGGGGPAAAALDARIRDLSRRRTDDVARRAADGGSGEGRYGGGTADYAGATADSFAQAFVDRFASAQGQGRGGGGGGAGGGGGGGGGGEAADGGSYRSLGSEGSRRGEVPPPRRPNGDDAGDAGGDKQWWVCGRCKTKAFTSQSELRHHEARCHSASASAGPALGPGPVETALAAAAFGNSVGTVSRGGSLGSSGRSARSQPPPPHRGGTSLAGGPVGGGPPPGPPGAFLHMNPYSMGMMCGDASGNPGAAGAMAAPAPFVMPMAVTSYAGGMPPGLAEAAARARASPQRRGSHHYPKEPTRELVEASKGPFKNLPKPVALSLPEDKDWLTPLHCFVRARCVEVFTATEADVQAPSKGKRKPIQEGQVGIRCPHCHAGHTDTDPSRERGSVYYPTSLSSVYNATMNLLQRHLHSCPKVPPEVMERYADLKKDDARSGTSKKYWIESARSLGFVDTLQGIKVSAREGVASSDKGGASVSQMMTRSTSEGGSEAGGSGEARGKSKDETDEDEDGDEAKKDKDEDEAEEGENAADNGEDDEKKAKKKHKKNDDSKSADPPSEAPPLVIPADKNTTTSFSFLLLSQMQPCVFTEADRLGKRKGLPAGFAGLACRHCFGGYGSGRFFPSSIKTLSDTSKTLNVLHNHMARCRKVSPDILDELESARANHDDERSKMKFGSQKAFFAKIWSRLHDNRPDGVVIRPPPRKPLNATHNGGLRRIGTSLEAQALGPAGFSEAASQAQANAAAMRMGVAGMPPAGMNPMMMGGAMPGMGPMAGMGMNQGMGMGMGMGAGMMPHPMMMADPSAMAHMGGGFTHGMHGMGGGMPYHGVMGGGMMMGMGSGRPGGPPGGAGVAADFGKRMMEVPYDGQGPEGKRMKMSRDSQDFLVQGPPA
ncbi:hypothetical protein ACHAWF_005293 [Thalassiosira exigua]